ncbi:MAG TPA: VOC family protein [Bacilli bacterium]|nr:VOC family protein [Bacilli bacterium]
MSVYHQGQMSRVSAVTLVVSDINKSLNFYAGILKLMPKSIANNEVDLSSDGITTLIKLIEVKGAKKPHHHLGLYHVALLLPSRKELGKTLAHLINEKYPLTGLSDHQVSEAIYLDDPDGNGIEIYADRPVVNGYDWHSYRSDQLTLPMDYRNVLLAGEGEPFTQLPTDTIIGHLHLHVDDLSKAKRFFTQGLGFSVMFDWGDSASFLATGHYHHHIGINTWNGKTATINSEHEIGIRNYTITLPDREKAVTIDRLSKLGYPIDSVNGIHTFDSNGTMVKLVFC